MHSDIQLIPPNILHCPRLLSGIDFAPVKILFVTQEELTLSFKVCALMASYNEEDIVEETIGKLINHGIDVYLIDNNSTDKTVEIASKFLNRGLIKIENLIFYENGKEVYNWTKILNRKEEISRELDYDWFIHVDADEIRYPPWENVSLKTAIEVVDGLGYNLINFKVFEFRITKSSKKIGLIEDRLKYYSPPRPGYNTRQAKAWKKCQDIDLAHDGGHSASFKNTRLFPIRFLLKHYPIRTIEQGIKKIQKDRWSRLVKDEIAKNWHTQYDHYSSDADKMPKELVEDETALQEFCATKANFELTLECTKVIALFMQLNSMNTKIIEKEDFGELPMTNKVEEAIHEILYDTMIELRAGKELDTGMNESVRYTVDRLLKKAALSEFFTGRVDLFDRVSPQIPAKN